MTKSISQLNSIANRNGSERVYVSRLSDTVTITDTSISALAADNSLNDANGNFNTIGLLEGHRVKITGFTNTANNIESAVVTEITANKITFGGADGDVIVDEIAGNSITITKWESVSGDYIPDDVIQTVDTLAELKAILPSLDSGSTILTKGRLAAGDGGGAEYSILTEAQANSAGYVLDGYTNVLSGGIAAIFAGSTITVKQAGAFPSGDATTNRAAIQSTLNSHVTGIRSVGDAPYPIDDKIDLKSNKIVTFDNGSHWTLTQSSAIGHVFGTAAGEAIGNIVIWNPQLDGGNFGYPTDTTNGENGLGIARATNVKSIGGHIKNCRRGENNTGGKGVQVEDDCYSVFVGGGLVIEECTKGFNTQGLASDPAREIIFDDIIVKECWEIFELDQFESPPNYSPENRSCRIDNIRAYNCGKTPTNTGSTTTAFVDTGAIVLNRYSNANIGSVTLVNDASYGTIPAFVVQHQSNYCVAENLEFWGDVTTLLDYRANATFGTGGSWRYCDFSIRHYGAVTTLARSDGSGTFDGLRHHIGTTDTSAIMQLGAITGQTDCAAKYENINTGQFIEGSTVSVQDSGITTLASVAGHYYVDNTAAIGPFRTSRSTQDRLNNARDVDVQFQRNGSTKLQFKAGTILAVLPTYADDTAAGAGGLVSGDMYKTAAGAVRIKT